MESIKKCCDNCKYYEWYYDKCLKLDCETNYNSMCSLYERYVNNNKTPVGGILNGSTERYKSYNAV